MIYLIVITSVLLFISIIDARIKYRRITRFNELKVIYDNMEMFAIEQNIVPTNILLNFLKSYKFLIVNKEFADVRIALGMRLLISDDEFDKKRMKWSLLKKQLPQELIEYGEEFNKIYDDLIKLSYWNLSFLWFLFKTSIRYAYQSLPEFISGSRKEVYRVFKGLRDLFSNENIILQNYNMSNVEGQLNELCI